MESLCIFLYTIRSKEKCALGQWHKCYSQWQKAPQISTVNSQTAPNNWSRLCPADTVV